VVINTGPEAVLVIGVHREELAFGERVAARVSSSTLDVLRIPEGLSGRRPRADQRFLYDTRHREIYLQLLPHVLGRYRLVIDLHTGVDEKGSPCADVLCADARFLACVAPAAEPQLASGCGVRPVLLTAPTRRQAEGRTPTDVLRAETALPPKVWDSDAFIYVGVEVYLPQAGEGDAAAWAFAADLMERLIGCAGTGYEGAQAGFRGRESGTA
jgi:hypothetical protein